jgi:NAD(P)-dependent dehydrogenase (short-subunit alcohol dehydrogenase family)
LDELQVVQREIVEAEGSAIVVPGSITESAVMAAAVEHIRQVLGGVDVLVNTAGISPAFTRAEDLSDQTWQSIINVNLSGTFICCREAGRLMLDAGGGSIINVSSVHASAGFGRLAAYASSKGGVEALTRALAIEWAQRGIRVNCVAPGYFATQLSEPMLTSARLRTSVIDRTPLRRIAEPEEVVGAIIFLASDESSFVTGTTMYVDGGWTAA